MPALVTEHGKRKSRKHHPGHLTKEELSRYLPENSVEMILPWFPGNSVRLIITRNRSSKSGDYRSPLNGSLAVISVNKNLNPYHFLITLVHEMAHHNVYLEAVAANKGFFSRKRRPKPHGPEWKKQFRGLMAPYLDDKIFPPELKEALAKHFRNPKASTTADHHLLTILKSYDEPDGSVPVESLPLDAFFRLPNGWIFQKKEKARKRYRCILQGTKRIYLFQPGTRVFLVNIE